MWPEREQLWPEREQLWPEREQLWPVKREMQQAWIDLPLRLHVGDETVKVEQHLGSGAFGMSTK